MAYLSVKIQKILDMELKPIIEDILHIVSPFYVEKIDKNEAKKEVHIHGASDLESGACGAFCVFFSLAWV